MIIYALIVFALTLILSEFKIDVVFGILLLALVIYLAVSL